MYKKKKGLFSNEGRIKIWSNFKRYFDECLNSTFGFRRAMLGVGVWFETNSI